MWLLSERAGVVVPGFTVDAANAGQVLVLCRKLDGIPLALELAAVRLGSLSLEQLTQGLASELSILHGQPGCSSPASRPWRRPSAGATACSTSGNGCCGPGCQCSPAASRKTRRGRSAPMSASRLGGSPACWGALVDKSILKRQLAGGGPPRYWLLETMRQYGSARLREAGEQSYHRA